jgi:hypothetical protein
MTYCTVVEFEWDETFDHEGFARITGNTGEGKARIPGHRLRRVLTPVRYRRRHRTSSG